MPCDKTFLYFCPAPDSPSGVLQGVLLTLSMCLLLLALLVLVLWLHHTGQDGRLRKGRGDKDEFYNEIRYTPSLMKRSFVWFLKDFWDFLMYPCKRCLQPRPVFPECYSTAVKHQKLWNKCSERCDSNASHLCSFPPNQLLKVTINDPLSFNQRQKTALKVKSPSFM